MKIDFFFAWTKNKDKSDEYTKAVDGGFKLPSFLRWLNIFKKNKNEDK
ncbi:MAG: hypothetical protein ACOCQB_00365 [Halanaerobiaceae bacterium]